MSFTQPQYLPNNLSLPIKLSVQAIFLPAESFAKIKSIFFLSSVLDRNLKKLKFKYL